MLVIADYAHAGSEAILKYIEEKQHVRGAAYNQMGTGLAKSFILFNSTSKQGSFLPLDAVIMGKIEL